MFLLADGVDLFKESKIPFNPSPPVLKDRADQMQLRILGSAQQSLKLKSLMSSLGRLNLRPGVGTTLQ